MGRSAYSLGAFVGGALWAWSIIRFSVGMGSWRTALLTGLPFGILIILISYSLELIELELFRNERLNRPGVHLQFLFLFSAGVLLVVGLTGLVLTLQIMPAKPATRPSGLASVLAAITFAAVDLMMYVIGWRVGDPNFPERSTMLAVASLGLLAAALVGGTTIRPLIDRYV